MGVTAAGTATRSVRMNPSEVRDIFESARAARIDLDRRSARLARINASAMSSGIPQAIRGGMSDPTATAGQALADLDTTEERELEATLEARLERARRLCGGVRLCIGYTTGMVLQDYYCNGLDWKQVATINSISRATTIRLRDMAFEWIASVGEERARDGRGFAEDAENL